MSLSEISRRLRRTADSIESNAETLNQPNFLKLADSFLKTLAKLDTAIATTSGGPEVHAIETNLKSLFGSSRDTKRIGQIAKSVFGTAFNPKKTEDFSAYVARVAEQAVALGKKTAPAGSIANRLQSTRRIRKLQDRRRLDYEGG